MPTKKGTYTFTVKAENVSGSSTKQFSITIDAEQQKPQITHDYVRDGKVGEYFWGMLESDLAANWSISGSLPPGLALDCGSYSSGCYIEGTPTTTGTYSFTLKATNSVGSSEKAFSIKIYSEGSPPYIIAINTWLDNGTWGERYSQQFQAFDDTDEDITNKVNWSITSNSAYGCFNPYPPTPLPHLPPGLALNASNGTISGTPTEAGNYCFTVMAENSAGSDRREFRISIENVPAEILTASMLKGEVGALYNVSLQSKGSGITWSISSGSLPSGLRLNAETGVISGMPESGTEGDHTFEVRAENYFDYSSWWQEKEFTITVEAMKPAAITTETLAKGTVGSTYYGRISSTSYLATIEKTSGDDIPGLTLNPSGTFSGAPTKAGTYKFKVKATNEAGSAGEKELTLIVEEAPAVDDGSPIRSQIAVARGGNARAYAQGSAIVLENIPQNSKVEVYSLKGRQVYSGSSENSQTLRILVQSKGVYVVKANKAAYRISVR
ncbi:MAG: putative Ig domain-containing protein, partial [Fibromonadaceae bacterium]|jgi:hypothetical protein|nr:putative Ig domain-containing protein [Fibromonadaceae bacterium]